MTSKKKGVTMLTLIRIKDYGETVMGVMFDTDKKLGTYYTIERKSKLVPVGLYDLDLTYSPKFKKKLPLVHNKSVSERRGIRIHAGNTVNDTEGCILIGNISSLTDRRISESNIAVNQLVNAMNGKPVKLSIRDVQSNGRNIVTGQLEK